MVFLINISQSLQRHMCVNLRGGNVRVAKNRLHGAQIGAILDHMRSTTVAKHVRAGTMSSTRTRGPDHLPDSLPREFPSSAPYKKKR